MLFSLFKIPSLFLVFSNLNMICHDVAFWCSFCLEFFELPGYLIWFVFCHSFCKFLGFYKFKYFFSFFSLCSAINPIIYIRRFKSVSYCLNVILCLFFPSFLFFSLNFSLVCIYQPIFKLTDSLLISLQSNNESIKGILRFLLLFFLFLAFPFNFLEFPLCSYIDHLLLHAVYHLSC